MFLTESDYGSQVREEVLDIITDAGDQSIWDDAELKAQAQIESHICNRYDVDQIFIQVYDYDPADTYNADDQVVKNGKVYYALQAATGQDPEAASSAYWKLGDKRNRHIVRITVDIALYLLYSSNNSRALPEHIKNNYEDALNWLAQVSKGNIGPRLPLLAEDSGNPVKWGSEPRQGHYW